MEERQAVGCEVDVLFAKGGIDMKSILRAYRKLLGIFWREAPGMVLATLLSAVLSGLMMPLIVFVSQHVFDDGLAVAAGTMTFAEYTPILVLLVATSLLPALLDQFLVYGYVEPKSQLILNTTYKGEMLQKLKQLRYEHLENPATMEVIDKAYNRAINSARHLFPMYLHTALSSVIASVGVLWYFGSVRWWLLLTILAPMALETWVSAKRHYNIYEEMERYWNRERQYGILAGFFRSRDYLYEGKLNASSDHLINTYRSRLNSRNREYEKFYYKHLKQLLLGGNITKIAVVGNVLLLLLLFLNGAMSVGLFISLTLQMFTSVYDKLSGCTFPIRWAGFHIKTFEYYDQYFALSEEEKGVENLAPDDCTIEFRDVWFHYPEGQSASEIQYDEQNRPLPPPRNPDVLRGLSFTLHPGEKVSVVGENGEGKSTMIKLLLGLFTPDRGEILLGGRPLAEYSREVRNAVFAPVFQDFTRYSISLRENIAVGCIDRSDDASVRAAAWQGRADAVAEELPQGYDTLLGRDFEGGVDLSGGQWQRVAIARAFMGNKPVLLLDEPTSQLDPIAESKLYAEFAEMSADKTALFITHRLASTMITDRILVIHEGRITEEGTHDALMRQGGLYARMFEAQRKWYVHEEAAI